MAELVNKSIEDIKDKLYKSLQAEFEVIEAVKYHLTQIYEGAANDLDILKANYEATIRAEVIGEFAERMKWEYENSIGIPKREIDFASAVIDQVAKRLIGGNDHEQYYQGNT